MGGSDLPRLGRMVSSGDLQLITLALIAEQPRHGYELIKLLEEKTSGAYSPSPGMVYPTLTYLEEADYVTAQADGAKKLFSITDAGRAYLKENRSYADALIARLVAAGEKIAQIRRRYEREDRDDRHPAIPPLVRAALENLRDVAAKELDAAPAAETRIVEILARVADELRKK
jgi:DNA-binding PadR family transcriptional regulator